MVYQRYCSNCGHPLELNNEKCSNCGHKVHFDPVNDDFIFKLPIYDVGFFNFNIDFSPYIENPNKLCDYYLCPKCNALKKYVGNHKEDNCPNCDVSNNFLNNIKNIISYSHNHNRTFIEKLDCEDEIELPEISKPKTFFQQDGPENSSEFTDDGKNFERHYQNPIYCIKCGAENYVGSTFCQNCGFNFEKYDGKINKLSIICTCGTVNNIDDAFCSSCGNALNLESEAVICICGERYGNPNKKFCDKCKRRLNSKRIVKTGIVCDKCNSILDFSTEYCHNCGKRISKRKLRNLFRGR